MALVTGLMLTACGEVTLNLPEKRQKVVKDIEHDIAEYDYAIDPGDLVEIEDNIMLILTTAPAEFFGGYGIDESFLLYIASIYGKDALSDIASDMKSGTDIWRSVTGNSIHVLMSDYCFFTGTNSSDIEKVYYKDCASDDEIVMDFTGDINLAENMGTVTWMDDTERNLAQCMDPDVFDELTGADILVVNNECTLSTKGSPIPNKAYTFEGDPARVKNLLDIGVDMAGIANNHIFDYGEEALLETVDVLEGAGIPHAGAGKNIDEASAPVFFIANGRKISVVCATQIERSYNYTREATEDTPGVLKSLNPERTIEVIEDAKAVSDICIVFIHWGTEGDENFGADQRNLAVQYERAGADAVIGGHTHCLQGMTYVNECPVVYSLGNFWFSSTPSMPGDYDTGIARLIIKDNNKLELSFVPCRFSGGIVSELHGDLAVTLYDYLTGISDGATVDHEGNVIKL